MPYLCDAFARQAHISSGQQRPGRAKRLKVKGGIAQMAKHLSAPAPRRGSVTVARELLTHVSEIGHDIEALVQRAGLPHRATAILDPDWAGQLSREEFALLYAECTWALDAQASYQEGRSPLIKAELDMLCYCIISCKDLRDAISRAATFSEMLMPRFARLTLRDVGGIAELRMATSRGVRNASSCISDLTGLSTLHRLFGWMTGQDIELIAVNLRYPPLAGIDVSALLMPHLITHRADENALRFSSRYLQCPIVREPAELEKLLEHFPFDLEEVQSKMEPLSQQIRRVLSAALAKSLPLPTGLELASQFSISPATLKRRLKEEKTTLQSLKDACRGALAQSLLLDQNIAIGEIAQRIGFSDSPTFSRAFRQWTGSTPGKWRACKMTKP
jgi:AraC-like DNA-binding protein